LFELTLEDARLERAKRFVLDGLTCGARKPIVARTFPFDQIADAHRFLESNQQIGKAFVTA
jgi:NADPH:quinone reductase-like Zn-dependent oxidoreductase